MRHTKSKKNNNYNAEITETMSMLALANLELKDYQKSQDFIQKGINNRIDSKKINSQLHYYASRLAHEQRDFANALDHYKKFVSYRDSTVDENVLKNINEIEVKYETEKKDKALAEQKLELVQKESQLQRKKVQYGLMTGMTIFLLATSLLTWLFFRQRQKRKNQEIITLKREQQVKTLESLIEGEENERLRIAKELHDGVNGDLSAIKYKLTSLLEKNAKIVNELVEMIDKSSRHVRAISHNLVPPALEKFSLLEALEDYCQTMNGIHKPQIDFQHLGESMRLSKNAEVNIYRIIQELVQNSIKHSEATEITVQTSHRANNLQIIVEDNGKGFDPGHIQTKGIGLANIHSRIEYLKGTMDFISNEKGTSYTIEMDSTKLI